MAAAFVGLIDGRHSRTRVFRHITAVTGFEFSVQSFRGTHGVLRAVVLKIIVKAVSSDGVYIYIYMYAYRLQLTLAITYKRRRYIIYTTKLYTYIFTRHSAGIRTILIIGI